MLFKRVKNIKLAFLGCHFEWNRTNRE